MCIYVSIVFVCVHIYVLCMHKCMCVSMYVHVCCVSVFMCMFMCMCCVCACAQPVQKATCCVDCPKYPSNVATHSTKDSVSILAEKTIF